LPGKYFNPKGSFFGIEVICQIKYRVLQLS
jgi:hypothetical protein